MTRPRSEQGRVFKWATVVTVSPLTITTDGSSTAIAADYNVGTHSALAVDARVIWAMIGRQVIVFIPN